VFRRFPAQVSSWVFPRQDLLWSVGGK
jgi:hypothetical protein